MSATNRGSIRRENDFYPTPPAPIYSLLGQLKTRVAREMVWGEPCKGDGSLINTVNRALNISHDQWRWAELTLGRDYLEDGLPGVIDGIITNPPFSLFQEFLDMSILETNFVAYLLPLNCYGSAKRKAWWQSCLPTHQFTLADRPSFTNDGKTDAAVYAWFVYDDIGLCVNPPGIYVI